MTGPYRVAVYAAPGSGNDPYAADLLERAESWLGRSAVGRTIEPGVPHGWTREAVDALTAEARRYGFHGTLKAPFRLADGRTLDELDEAVAGFAAGQPDVLIPQLALTRLGDFFALTPGADAAPLSALADDVVTVLDDFRAPLTESEIGRRNPEKLSERQRGFLARWGYPYVFDEFRFHLTVTDRVPTDQQEDVQQTLCTWFAGSLGRDIAVDVLAIFVEAEPGAPFELYAEHPLSRHPTRSTGATTSHTPSSPASRARVKEEVR